MIPKFFFTSASSWMLVPFTDMRGRAFIFFWRNNEFCFSHTGFVVLMGLSDGDPLNVCNLGKAFLTCV